MTTDKKVNRVWWFYVLIFAIFLFPRLFDLGSEGYGSDSQKWLRRSDDFILRLSNGNLEGTYVTYHPGVTVMWLSGVTKHFYYNYVKATDGVDIKQASGVVIPQYFESTLAVSKIPLVLFISILLTLSAIILNKIGLSKLHVVIFALMLSLEPFFLGVSTQLHLTGLETALAFSSIIFALYYQKTANKKVLLATGLLLGLGILTKVTFLVVILFVFALLSYRHLLNFSKQSIKNLLYEFILISIPLVLIVMILWPVVWINPTRVVNSIILQGFRETALVDEPADSISKIRALFYPEVFLAKSLTITSLLFIASLILIPLKKKSDGRKVLIVSLLFILYYLVMMSIPTKVMHRYFVVVYPFIILCGSYVLAKLLREIKSIPAAIIISTIVFYYLFSMYMVYPNYTLYYSEIFGYANGFSKKADTFGDSFYNSSTYISSSSINKPENILIVVPSNKAYYYQGNFLGKVNAGLRTGSLCDVNQREYYLLLEHDQKVYKTAGKCDLFKTFGNRQPDGYVSVRLYHCKL